MEEEYEELKEIEITEEYCDEESDEVSVMEIVKDISTGGKYVSGYYETNHELPKNYSQFVINLAFSNYRDTILIVNEMNKYPNIPDWAHWRFLSSVIPPMKRFSKWDRQKDISNIELLAKYFHCSVKEMQKNVYAIPKNKLNELLKSLKNDMRKK